ncbi:MAG: IS21 family transposase [Capsulimonadaceae bacterium]
MRTIREVLRLNHQGRSQRFIASSCRISATTVGEYLYRAKSAGVVWPLPDETTDELLERLLYPPEPRSADARPIPDWSAVVVELRRKAVTLFLLWEEYRATHPNAYGYSRYCEMFQEYARTLDPRMRQAHKAGEKLFIDYAGMTMQVIDRITGEVREVQIYVGTLGASDLTYAEATWTQSLPDFIGSQVRNLTYIGGVPEMIVPDNLKSGVTSPCRYEPDINVTYLKFAEYYNVAIIPARVAKPRDKAKVENHVLNVEQRVLAPLRDRVFFSLEELNQAIWELLEDLNNRPFQKIPGNRRYLFETVDAPALRPLPAKPYVVGIWSKARVNIDYHIEVDEAYYSVPYTLLRKQMEVHLTARIVEVFYKGNRVASHPRSYVPGYYTTDPLHMPKAHREFAEWTPERLVRWARESGGSTAGMVEAILQRYVHPQQGFRSCLGIISLGKKFGPERLEAACRRGLTLGTISYKSVKSILDSNLDQATLPVAEPEPVPIHSNIRGASYYATPTDDSPPSLQMAFLLEEER